MTGDDAAESAGATGRVPPLPSPDQLAWQTQELTAFLHFGMDTFTDQEEGNGAASPMLFNPTALDAVQWMATLQSAGFRQAMLTAKHHDGFCLWPTKCTSYSVAASPWLGGQGDV
ncbi:MAG TPA: alpha-L-fucosidase, partial [Polyangiaceae bacterium]|nr:alpha-L-fucosidase [Polyangiaceae bacterium]